MQQDVRSDAPNAPRSLSRRDFVRVLTAATAGSGLIAATFAGFVLTPAQRAEAAEAIAAKVGKLPRRQLGKRMGKMAVTPIFICQDWNRDLYAPGLAAGINFIHKAGYWNRMPDELKNVPRDSYYTDITVDSTPDRPDDEERAYSQVTDSLNKNGLRYYDLMRAHFGWKTVAEMKEKRGTYRAFQRLKKEGKVKYFGVSQHDYVPYPEIIAAEIDEGLIDCMQVFFSYSSPATTREIFEKARKAGVGMVAMKVIAQGGDKMRQDTARQIALKSDGKVGRACLRHVLGVRGADGKPVFDACVSNIQSFEQFEENIGAASLKVAAADGYALV